jgi:hypothetical protein
VRSVVREASHDGQSAPSFSALINAIVKSTPFQMRRTPVS